MPAFFQFLKALFSWLAAFTKQQQNTRCRLHNCALEPGAAATKPGFSRSSAAYARACKEQFPNANSLVPESFQLDPYAHALASELLHCKACRQAEEKWIQKNPLDFSSSISLPEFKKHSKQDSLSESDAKAEDDRK